MYDSSPLAAYIAKVFTPEVLKRVAAAYDDNRRLWVGTTSFDYNQTWVWNMTLIAKQGGPDALDLYRKVLRASGSPPVAFPPVEMSGHLFGDGGVRENVVVVGFAGAEKPKPPLHGSGIGDNMLAFDHKQIRNGFDAGYAMAKTPKPWAHVPPIYDDFPPWTLDAIISPGAAAN